jgi:hypothetical protein
LIDQRLRKGSVPAAGAVVRKRKFGRQRRIDAINATVLASPPRIRVGFPGANAPGLRNRLRLLTDIGQPRGVLALSCLNQKATLCCSAMRTERTDGRAEDFGLRLQLKARTQKQRQIFYLNRL